MAEVKIKDLAKELYLKGFDTKKVAEILSKQEKTISNYKAQDGDWDKLRAVGVIQDAKTNGENIYQSFIEEMRLAIKDIRESELKAEAKATALCKVGDSFVKMSKVARIEDPSVYKLSIAKKVIYLVVEKFRDSSSKDCIEKLVQLIESDKFIKAIEELDVI